MALYGNLRDLSPSQLLNLISLARRTGMLKVEGVDSVRLWFREGKLIHASNGSDRNNLAHLLQMSGYLTEKQVAIIENKASGTSDKELGHLLVSAGYVSQGDIIQSLRDHATKLVTMLISWSEGDYHFTADDPPPEGRIIVTVDLESIIMEGSRLQQAQQRLRQAIPSLGASLRLVGTPDARLNELNLTVEEWHIISEIAPGRSLSTIASANGLSDFEIRRIVFALLRNGLVELVGEPASVGADDGTSSFNSGRSHDHEGDGQAEERRSLVRKLIDRVRHN